MEIFLKQMEGYYKPRCGNTFQIACHLPFQKDRIKTEPWRPYTNAKKRLILPCSSHLYFGHFFYQERKTKAK